MTDQYTTVDLIHLAILRDAADEANRQYAQEFDISGDRAWRPGRFRPEKRQQVHGDLFRPDPLQSEKGGLCLSIDPVIVQALDASTQERVREIGRKALKKAVVQNQRAFVGLILGEAREGRNYFDRYDQSDQLRLM